MLNSKLKNLIKKIDNEGIEEKTNLKVTKSVRLLKEIFNNLKESKVKDSKHFDKVELLLNDVLNKKFDNLDNVKKDIVSITELLKQSLDKDNQVEIVKKINDLINILDKKKFPKDIKVSNFPEQKTDVKITNFPEQKEFPKEIKVNNFPEQKTEIKVNNFPEQKEFPKEIDVKGIKEEINIKQPKWYKKFDITPFWDKLVTLLTNLSKGEFKIKAKEHEQADNALAVKIVDDKGKFIKDLIPRIHVNPAGSGGSADPTGLKNKAGNQINPATEDKQDSIIESIKAEDSPHVSGDKGIMPLTVRCNDLCTLVGTNGDYQPLITNEHGILRTQSQQHYHIDCCEVTTGWTVLGNDTTNLATTTNHALGTLALKFDKVDGAANTVFAGIQKTISSIDLTAYHKGGGFFCCSIYVSDTTNIDYAFLRVGTDSSNYNEWRGDQEDMVVGWNAFKKSMLKPDAYVGNGWNSTAVAYIAIGIAFGNENDTLADIAIDHIATNTGLQTTTDILQTTIPSMNLLKVGNKIVNVGAGNAGTGTQRVSISTDDVNLAAIKTNTNFPAGTGSNGSVTLTNADTAYDVPTVAPTTNYKITLYNGSDTSIYWGYEDSNSNGVLLVSGSQINLDIGANDVVYCYCGAGGKVITYSLKEI